MIFSPRLAVVLSASLLFLAGCGPISFDITVPRETIVQRLAGQFPLTRTSGPMTLTLSNPHIDFETAQNRIGMRAEVTVEMEGMPPARGETAFDGTLTFENLAFVFGDVTMKKFEVSGLPDDGGRLQELMRRSVLREIRNMTVYHIHADDPKEKLAAETLQGVRVSDTGLVITLGTR
jgi:hypothetical protein